MTIAQAKEILRHWDDVLWRSQNHITMGDVSDALQIAEEALSSPWHKASEELPEESGSYLVKYTIDSCSVPYDGICHYYECRWINAHLLGNGRIHITHWMPLSQNYQRRTDMDAEMRKRLEEAENNYVGYVFSPNERPEISSVRTAFYAGVGHGYKEAIAQCKEWMEKHIPCIRTLEEDVIYAHGFRCIPMSSFISDFEADMNKLWEEKK